MNEYTIYDYRDGRILANFSCSDPESVNVNLQHYPYGTFVPGRFDPEKHFGHDNVIYERQQMDIPEEITMAVGEQKPVNLPAETEIFVNDAEQPIVTSELTLTSDMPAEYTLRFVCFPWYERTTKVMIHAV